MCKNLSIVFLSHRIVAKAKRFQRLTCTTILVKRLLCTNNICNAKRHRNLSCGTGASVVCKRRSVIHGRSEVHSALACWYVVISTPLPPPHANRQPTKLRAERERERACTNSYMYYKTFVVTRILFAGNRRT